LAQRDNRAFAAGSSTLELLSRTSWEKHFKIAPEATKTEAAKLQSSASSETQPTLDMTMEADYQFSHIKCTATRETFVEFYLQQQDFWIIFAS